MIVLKIVAGVFAIAWIWVTYELVTSPIVDEEGNEIE